MNVVATKNFETIIFFFYRVPENEERFPGDAVRFLAGFADKKGGDFVPARTIPNSGYAEKYFSANPHNPLFTFID